MTTIVFDGKTLADKLTLNRSKSPLNAGLFFGVVVIFYVILTGIRR